MCLGGVSSGLPGFDALARAKDNWDIGLEIAFIGFGSIGIAIPAGCS